MAKFDLKQELAPLYAPPAGAFVLVDVPPLDYLMIDGAGDPNRCADYPAAVESLYTASYAAKFISKRECDADYVVPPLEGLWWADDWAVFEKGDKASWQWTMMIAVPAFVDRTIVVRALADAARKKPALPIGRLRFERLEEKRAVQTLHIGSYDEEAPLLARLHRDFLPANDWRPSGKHHEIYLSDPRKVEATRLKTILRQPVEPL